MTIQTELPEFFQLTAEQRAEIKKLGTALREKCVEFEAPFMIAICLGNEENGSEVAESNYFNGERTPDCMAIARVIVDKNITNPLQLLALITK